MRNNKKGFTLIELLAVIVVLAILILLAMPKVTSMMEKARRNSFAIEVNEIVKVANTAYSDKLMDGQSINAVCLPVDMLIKEGYLDADADNLSGYVKIQVEYDEGKSAKTTITTKISKMNMYIDNTGTGKFDASDVKNNKSKNAYAKVDSLYETNPSTYSCADISVNAE